MGAVPVCAGRSVINAYYNLRSIVAGRSGYDDEDLVYERPPQLEPQTIVEDTITQDWRWLALRCERRLVQQANRTAPSRRVAEILGENFNIDQFACFMPRTVLEAIADGRIRYSDDFDVIIEHFNAAVVFCDASGFTALTEALDKQPDGAEKLGKSINKYFEPLIQLVHLWGGDIIKFSGDALTIVWPVDDDDGEGDAGGGSVEERVSKLRTTGEYRIDRNIACRLACQCCLDLHANLDDVPTEVPGKVFTLHIGIGYGKVTILQVGGTLDRWEYVVAGPPMQQISVAEPLAGSGETVISPTVVQGIGGDEGGHLEQIPEAPGFAKLFNLRGPKISPPPPLENVVLQDSDVELLRRFIPPAVYKRLTAGYNVFINELRRVSVVFVGVHGLDVSTEKGASAAHRLMQMTQKAAYTMEGSVNKFLVDDKGVLILLMFGLPPVYHLDDALRAVMAALRIVDGLKSLGLTAGIGVATGRVWCGTVGCDLRKEYTAMGDTVNLAARLMGKCGANEINCDQETKNLCENVMVFQSLPPVKMKGKAHRVAVYQPTGQMRRRAVLQTTTGEPVSTWKSWKHKKRIHKLLLPGYEFRVPIVDVDRPPLDFPSNAQPGTPVPLGPKLPWEMTDPWLPSLRPTVDLGGVAVIIGKETEGTTELVHYINEISKTLGRSAFFCSNMPDSCHVNIGNVPLLAWRKLSTELVEKWRWSSARSRRGYSSVDLDNSVYGLTKELVHPIFHWRLHEMKSVIHGLILPSEVPENRYRHALRNKSRQERRAALRAAKSRSSYFLNNVIKRPMRKMQMAAAARTEIEEQELDNDLDEDLFFSRLPALSSSTGDDENSTVIPVICSLVNGFSMYECTIVVLHVRSGTSLFASMDSDSWKVARLVGRVAMMRRRRKIEVDLQDLKQWRRTHCRKCVWCQGCATPYVRLSGEVTSPTWTCNCRPPPSQYLPPFLFVLVCSDLTNHIPEQRELIEWAKESNAFIQVKRMVPVETSSYLAHCLAVSRRGLPDPLVEYVHRISGGIPKYCYLTARQLLEQSAIVVENVAKERRLKEACMARLRSSDPRAFLLRKRKTALQPPTLHRNTSANSDTMARGNSEGVISNADSVVSKDGPTDDSTDGGRAGSGGDAPFELRAQHLTGRSGIPVEAETEDADSEREDTAPGGGQLGVAKPGRLCVYRFNTEWPVHVTGTKSGKSSRGRPRIAEMSLVKISDEIESINGVYVKKDAETSAVYRRLDAEAASFSRLLTDIDRLDPELLSLRKAYNRDFFLALQEATDPIKVAARRLSANALSLHSMMSQPKIVRPFLPPGPELFISAAAATQPATVKLRSSERYETSYRATLAAKSKQQQHLDDKRPKAPPQFSPPPYYEGAVLSAAPRKQRSHMTESDELEDEEDVDETASEPPAPRIREALPRSLYATKSSTSVVRVLKDLKTVPFVSELRAAAMSLMERLEPDEQLAAKVASVFPVAFTAFELGAVYPCRMTAEFFCKFQRMVENLIQKEMLESCGPPTEEQLSDLDLSLLQPIDEFGKRSSKLSTVERALPAATEAPTGESATNVVPLFEAASVRSDNEGIVNLSVDKDQYQMFNRWGFDEDGNAVFYRFTSIAHQHVVADLLMAEDRAFLRRIARKVVAFRRTYGLRFLIAQINNKVAESTSAAAVTTVAPLLDESLSSGGGTSAAASWQDSAVQDLR